MPVAEHERHGPVGGPGRLDPLGEGRGSRRSASSASARSRLDDRARARDRSAPSRRPGAWLSGSALRITRPRSETSQAPQPSLTTASGRSGTTTTRSVCGKGAVESHEWTVGRAVSRARSSSSSSATRLVPANCAPACAPTPGRPAAPGHLDLLEREERRVTSRPVREADDASNDPARTTSSADERPAQTPAQPVCGHECKMRSADHGTEFAARRLGPTRPGRAAGSRAAPSSCTSGWRTTPNCSSARRRPRR